MIDVSNLTLKLDLRQAFVERPVVVVVIKILAAPKLRRDDNCTCPINISPTSADLNSRHSLGKVAYPRVFGLYDDPPAVVDESIVLPPGVSIRAPSKVGRTI